MKFNKHDDIDKIKPELRRREETQERKVRKEGNKKRRLYN